MSCTIEEKSYIFKVTFVSFPDFERIPTRILFEPNKEDMKNDFMNMLGESVGESADRASERLMEYGSFCFLACETPCVLTNFIDSHQAKIVGVNFDLLYKSKDPEQHPHFLSVAVYLIEKEIDFTRVNWESSARVPDSILERLLFTMISQSLFCPASSRFATTCRDKILFFLNKCKKIKHKSNVSDTEFLLFVS